ncbi:sugar ABC transporter ATP-binding protein [Methylobacterium terricola]|uniref:Sugar ABC transporter ATP-binding protein n=1 Tax=Methylobacterium terricola TaxID=2583531 RepID=A0A5C4LKK6_9HYPH|nr:sugar ABC transporter ATP-binding protein [Methylobacterium terricola]TNC14954.1 sugar ABC transporter ATP-binding protein [Methylobacterium terricola]
MQSSNLSGLSIEGIAKSYGATVALERVSIHLAAGQVHALLGENGAGKSTLVKILSGVVRPDTGQMLLDGQTYMPGTILDARARGVATAFQELSLPSNLTVAECLLMPTLRKGRGGLVSARRTVAAAAEILARYDLRSVAPSALISDLSLAERQRVEIVRAFHHADRVLVLDEPTAALSDVTWLFDQIRRATARGIAILYISHRLAEVRSLCPVATVLRNGRSVATVDLRQADDDEIFELMVGHSKASESVRRSRVTVGAPVLEVRGLTTPKLADVSFTIGAGEILGVSALDGQGQRSLFYALAGLEKRLAGEVLVEGRPSRPGKPGDALRDGIGLLPEERKTEGILANLSSASNIVLPILDRIGRRGFVWPALERAAALESARAVELSPRYVSFRIGDLSGGNQQKALLARTMASGARTLLLFDPTRGVDVGTKEAIYAAIQAFADRGGSVLMYSSELPEIVRLADRCLVLYGGRVFTELAGPELEERTMVAALTGYTSAPLARGAAR